MKAIVTVCFIINQNKNRVWKGVRSAFDFYYHAESMYYERLQGGDYLIAGNYKKAITSQEEIREKRNENLPDFNWVK